MHQKHGSVMFCAGVLSWWRDTNLPQQGFKHTFLSHHRGQRNILRISMIYLVWEMAQSRSFSIQIHSLIHSKSNLEVHVMLLGGGSSCHQINIYLWNSKEEWEFFLNLGTGRSCKINKINMLLFTSLRKYSHFKKNPKDLSFCFILLLINHLLPRNISLCSKTMCFTHKWQSTLKYRIGEY